MRTLYVSDLDGTLLHNDETLSDDTKALLHALQENGGVFAYATARSYHTAQKVTAGLSCTFAIVYNGAFVIDCRSGKRVIEHFFSEDACADLKRLLTQYRIEPICYACHGDQEFYSYHPALINDATRSFLDTRKGDVRDHPVASSQDLFSGSLFYVTMIGDDRLADLYERLKADPRFHVVYQKDHYSDAMWLEVMSAQAGKGEAIKACRKLMGITEVICFGDSLNDLSLFAASDYACAMGNALEAVKKQADEVILSNEEDGVAKWIMVHMQRQKDWFTVRQLEKDTWCISEPKHYENPHSYLLVGEKRALLIDCGLGIGELSQVVSKLCDVPIVVTLTHAHWDHMGAYGDFDERLLYHDEASWLKHYPLSSEAIKEQLTKEPCDYPAAFHLENYAIYQGEADHLLQDGEIIDLGNRRIQVIHTPGHSPGHVCYYEATRQTLYSGDLIYLGKLDMFYPTTDPHAFASSIKKLAAFDVKTIRPGHNTLRISPDVIGKIDAAFEQLKARGVCVQGSGIYDFGDFQLHL